MLQVYTGDGKGKTTAAIGLAIRALGAGKRVYLKQFMKSLAYSEQKILREFSPQLVLEVTGKPFFIAAEGMLDEAALREWGDDVVVFPPGQPPPDYVAMMRQGLAEAACQIKSGQYGLAILDEINVALHFALVSREEVESLIGSAPAATEIVCTGRKAPPWLVERADLVTDMREVKHYYSRGVTARVGIEN